MNESKDREIPLTSAQIKALEQRSQTILRGGTRIEGLRAPRHWSNVFSDPYFFQKNVTIVEQARTHAQDLHEMAQALSKRTAVVIDQQRDAQGRIIGFVFQIGEGNQTSRDLNDFDDLLDVLKPRIVHRQKLSPKHPYSLASEGFNLGQRLILCTHPQNDKMQEKS